MEHPSLLWRILQTNGVRCGIARVMKSYLRIYNSSYGHSQARSKLTTSNAGTNEPQCLTSLRSFLKAILILSAESTLTWPAAGLVYFYRSCRLRYFCRTDKFLSYSLSFIHILYNYLSNIISNVLLGHTHTLLQTSTWANYSVPWSDGCTGVGLQKFICPVSLTHASVSTLFHMQEIF